jgi:hypothetical protein
VLLRVIDIETKGLAPPAEVIEIGRVDVRLENSVASIERPKACLYRPLSGIPPETMAVHHITEADFTAETPICSEEKLRLAVWGGSTPSALVAHNCDFERSFIPEAITGDLPWICTHKGSAGLAICSTTLKPGLEILAWTSARWRACHATSPSGTGRVGHCAHFGRAGEDHLG